MSIVPSAADRVRERVRADFSAHVAAHDFGHLDRVARMAARIAASESADPEPARIAAYVHDYHRVVEHLEGGVIAPEAVWNRIEPILTEEEVEEAIRDEIRRAVELTGRYSFAGDSLEGWPVTAQAVHDADNLDALGAIGIARAFMYGGAQREELWVESAELKRVYSEGLTSSVIAHFYEKLLRLHDDMMTPYARRLAARRTRTLMDYLVEFHQEWGDPLAAPIRDMIPPETSRGTVCLGFGSSKEIDQRCTVIAHATVALTRGGDVVEATLTGLPSYLSDQLAPYRSARGLPLTDESLLFDPEQSSLWIRGDGRTAVRDLREGRVIAHLFFSSGVLVQARLEFIDPVFNDDKEEEPRAVL